MLNSVAGCLPHAASCPSSNTCEHGCHRYRCLHGALLEALQQEARALEGGSGAAGDDVEMQDAAAQGAPGGSAAAAGGTGGRRARVAVASLTPAQQDRVVEQMVQGADIQLGLVNACVEVGAAWLVGG